MEKLKNPAFIIMLLGIWYGFSVTYNNVGVIGNRLDKKIAVQNEMHTEIDEFKMEMTERMHQIELSVKDEKIERLEAENNRLKGK